MTRDSTVQKPDSGSLQRPYVLCTVHVVFLGKAPELSASVRSWLTSSACGRWLSGCLCPPRLLSPLARTQPKRMCTYTRGIWICQTQLSMGSMENGHPMWPFEHTYHPSSKTLTSQREKPWRSSFRQSTMEKQSLSSVFSSLMGTPSR